MTFSSLFLAGIGIVTALVVILVSVGRVIVARSERRDVVAPIVGGAVRCVGAIAAAVFFIGFDAITLPLIRLLEQAVVAVLSPAVASMPSFGGQSWTLLLLVFAIAINTLNIGIMIGSRR